MTEFEAKNQEVNEKKWKEFLQDRRAVPVKNITIGVPLRSRTAQDVIRAVSKIYSRVRAMRLPVVRLHTDRAREFSGAVFQEWCRARDVHHTMSSGDDPTSNSRAEREVGWIKGRARTLLQATKAPFQYWPLAIRHASEERLRIQVKEMGIKTPQLIPFGTKVVVKKKTWHHREDDSGMKWPMKRAVLWGPASDMSMSSCGYYLQDDEGRFFRSTVVHQVREEEDQPRSADQQDRIEEKDQSGEKSQLMEETLNDAPGNVEDATWDVGKGHNQEAEVKDISDCRGQEDGSEHQPLLELEEVEEKMDRIGARHDPPRRRYLIKSAPIQHDNYEAKLFKVMRRDWGDLEQLALKQHVAAREWSQELTCQVQEGIALEDDVNEIRRVNEEAQEIEHVLKQCQASQQQDEEEKIEEVTQTRLVSMDDVKKDLEQWKPVFKEEVEKLMQTALEPIDEKRFRELLQGDTEVECLPMKAIASIKPDKRKARIVVCGNFAKEKSAEEALDNAASGIDSVAIRTVLNAGAHRDWSAGTTDVASAFLQAPRRTNDRRITVCQPPSILRSMQLVGSQEKWIIHQALYGLQESPGDWGWYRDSRLAQLRWKLGDEECKFEETAERHLWKLCSIQQPDRELGYLMVYVDDMMLVGQDDYIRAAMDAIRGEWQCSDPQWLSAEKSMRFCGFEVKKKGEEIWLHQEGYTLNLLQKRKVTGEESVPLPKIHESEEVEQFSIQDVRAAQTLVGEVLWLSTRSRPDLAFAVGALGRMLHKRPQYTLKLGEHLMRYLNHTKTWGLRYRKCQRGDLGEADHLHSPRTTERLDVYSDVSYGPGHEGYRSIQGIAAEHAGNLVAWETGRQAIIALSTCEAELIAFSEAHQVGDSVAELLSVVGFKVGKTLHGDSKAALSAATMESGPWRTRHLRLRAFALRTALRTPESGWSAKHLRGEHLLADGLTKPLQSLAFVRFCRKLNLGGSCDSECVAEETQPTSGCVKQLAIGGSVALLAAVACRQSGDDRVSSILKLVALMMLLIWRVGTSRASGLRPETRPQKDPKNIWGRDTHCERLDRSGTVTQMSGTGKPTDKQEVEKEMPRVCAMRRPDRGQDRALEGEQLQQSGARGSRALSMGYLREGAAQSFQGLDGDQVRQHGALREGEEDAEPQHRQLPISSRRTRQPEQSSSRARGRAAASSMVVLGSVEERRDQGQEEHFIEEEQVEGVATMNPRFWRPSPVRASLKEVQVMARVVREEDPPNAVAIWDLMRFSEPPRGDDKWILEVDNFLIRSHGRARTRSFHPLHRSTPIPLTELSSRRVTILFPVTGEGKMVKVDGWSKDLPLFRGQWKGFTIFEKIQRINYESSESDGSYEMIRP